MHPVASTTFLLLSLLGVSVVAAQEPLPPGAHYVAMGSSFAAGPGITQIEPGSPPRCARSLDNYAHQLARRRSLTLSDASCSGATTRHVLDAWNELPAQLDALRPDTRLVTVTIGGNDLGYMSGLVSASCLALGLGDGTARSPCRHVSAPSETEYQGVAARLAQIAGEVRRRAPRARLVFVDYVSVLPSSGGCERTPLATADAAAARAIDARLRQITGEVAKASGADLMKASEVTRDHHACAADPWIHGYSRPDPAAPVAFYHPTLAGMTAVAEALDRLLGPGSAPGPR
jgi:lysophospholipase L1-like esterase